MDDITGMILYLIQIRIGPDIFFFFHLLSEAYWLSNNSIADLPESTVVVVKLQSTFSEKVH